jgi:prepilin-type N-terminal cleavage/methylation domain-containing protein
MRYKRVYGFTMIELLVVLAIIGALIIIAVNGVKYAILYSHDQTYKQYLVGVEQVLDSYYAENNNYPYISCPSGTGTDGFATVTSLNNLVQANGSQTTKANWNTLLQEIKNTGLVPSFGYCSSPQVGATNGATAFMLIYFSTTSQACQDNGSPAKPFFALGHGTYTANGSFGNYYNLPALYGMGIISTAPNYGINCFNT